MGVLPGYFNPENKKQRKNLDENLGKGYMEQEADEHDFLDTERDADP